MERFSPLDVATFWLGTTPQQYRNYDQNIYFLTRTKNIRYKKLIHLNNCTHRAENPTSTTSKPRQTIRKTYVNTLGDEAHFGIANMPGRRDSLYLFQWNFQEQ